MQVRCELLMEFGETLQGWLNSRRTALWLGVGIEGSSTPEEPMLLCKVNYTDRTPDYKGFLYKLALGVKFCYYDYGGKNIFTL